MIVDGPEVIDWMRGKMDADFGRGATALGWKSNGELTAGVVYENWNGVSCVCHIAIDAPLTKGYAHAIHHYPFVYGGLRKLIAPVYEGNRKSIKLVERLDFRLEARLLDACPDGSVLIYTLDRDRCRFIMEKEYGQRLRSAPGT